MKPKRFWLKISRKRESHEKQKTSPDLFSGRLIHTLRNSKSERSTQLSFKGYGFDSDRKSGTIIKPILSFVVSLVRYLTKKVIDLLHLFRKFFTGISKLAHKGKEKSIQKLIWSRGKLGRPVVNLVVFTTAFLVFTIGKIFNSSNLINSQSVPQDYLVSTSDIIPQRELAATLVPESRKRTTYTTYTVRPGDTLSSIGQQFKISTDAIKYVNNLTEASILTVGKELSIPPVSGLIHTVKSGETLESIATKYDVPQQAVADFNYILNTSTLASGTELVIPDAKVPQPVYIPSVVPNIPILGPVIPAPNVGDGFCVWPTSASIISQHFSWYHNGLDIATPWGQAMPPLYACNEGIVTRAGWDPWGLGLHVEVDHQNGITTVYGHMSRIDVGYGQRVGRGEVLGFMGNTGRSTGPHVHFIVKSGGVPQNPLQFTQ
jgi:murein DD-endopeptidase MepM/ murein hydrolase activator NlpD